MSRWLLSLALVPSALFAAESFEGTWKIDVRKVELPTKVNKMEFSNGMYSCPTCVPVINVKADGTDQKVTGANTFDAMSVKVIDAKTVEITQKRVGKTVDVAKYTLSADGNHLTVHFTDYPPNSSQPVTGDATAMRVEKGPGGAHAISGGWRNEKLGTLSDNGATWTFKAAPGGLSYSDPTGETYTAKFDSKDYPTMGDPASDMVSLKKIDANTMDETYKKNGKVGVVNHYSIAADGKSGSMTSENKEQGTTTKFGIVKQ
jgi:hypothetical protein